MAVINTGLVAQGLKADFFARLGETKSHYQTLCTFTKSDNPGERYAFLGSVPQMRPWIGGRQAKPMFSESYSLENERYEATVEVDRQEIEDDRTGQIRWRMQELAARAATHKDYLIEQLLNNGDQANYNSYDGVSFFSDAHLSGNSSAQSNKLTYAAATGTDPTVEEFRAAFKQAVAQMIGFKDDQGLPMRIDPTSGMVCIVPATMYFTALDAMSLALAPNAQSPIARNVVQGAASVIVLPGLSSTAKWFLAKTDVPVRPFVYQERMPIEFSSIENPSDSHVFTKDKYLYGVRARYAVGYAYWQHIIQTSFT